MAAFKFIKRREFAKIGHKTKINETERKQNSLCPFERRKKAPAPPLAPPVEEARQSLPGRPPELAATFAQSERSICQTWRLLSSPEAGRDGSRRRPRGRRRRQDNLISIAAGEPPLNI